MRKQLSKMTFSKRILYVLGMVTGAVIVATFILAAAFRDLSPLQYIIVGLFSLCDIAVGFYYWKAKAENVRKYESKQLLQNVVDDVEENIKKYEVRRHG